jgi:cytoskeletal protein CcmA (bactofilin family)
MRVARDLSGPLTGSATLPSHLKPLPHMSILARRSGPTSTPAPAGSGYSLLDAQLSVTGDLDTSGSLRIDGKLEGNVRRADTVVLGVGATMSGDVHAREVVIGGTIVGNVHATERVELQATAIVTGDIVTQTILVQEGGVVNGRVLMRPPEGVVPTTTLHVSEGVTSSR